MDIRGPSYGAGTGSTFPAWEVRPRQGVLLDGRGRLKAAGRRQRPAREAGIIKAGEGFCRGDRGERDAAVALGSARQLAGGSGRIACGRELASGGVRPGCTRTLLCFPACQILPQCLGLPLFPGGLLLRLIPVVGHAAVPFSGPVPGLSSRPKVPQCQPVKVRKSSAGQVVNGGQGRGPLACQCHPHVACSAPSTAPP